MATLIKVLELYKNVIMTSREIVGILYRERVVQTEKKKRPGEKVDDRTSFSCQLSPVLRKRAISHDTDNLQKAVFYPLFRTNL